MNDANLNAAEAECARLRNILADLEARHSSLIAKADDLDRAGKDGALARFLAGGVDKLYARRRSESAALRAEAEAAVDAMADARQQLHEAEETRRRAAQADRLAGAHRAAARAERLSEDVADATRGLLNLLAQHRAAVDDAATLSGRRTVEASAEATALSVLRAIHSGSAIGWASMANVAAMLLSADTDIVAAGRDQLRAVAAMTRDDLAEAA